MHSLNACYPFWHVIPRPSHTSLVSLFSLFFPSVLRLLRSQSDSPCLDTQSSEPACLPPSPVPAHLTVAPVRAPGPLLSWQENKDSWQWEKSVKENMSRVVVLALLSENSLCQGAVSASHTCYTDRCFQLLSLTSLQARFLSYWLLLDSEGNKGNWG